MAGHTDNSIVINAPMDRVWDITCDVDNWTNLFSEYEKVEVLERKGDTIIFRLTTKPDQSGNVYSWTSERTTDPQTHTVKSHRIETGPFEFMNIEWYYEPVDGGTKMRWVQDFHMKPQAPNNDDQATDYLNTNTKIQMQVIKERVESRAASGS